MTQLAGLRVLEISGGLVDLGGRMLAEMGAEVISLETGMTANRPAARTLAWNHGKQRARMPVRAELEQSGLLREADILVEDRSASQADWLDELTAGDDRLIHVIARPFSPGGPYRERPATDLTLMAWSGLMTIVGEPDRPPLRLPGEQAYALTGIQVATAALLALHARRRTGQGQRVDVSGMQSTTLANYREAIMYEWTGRVGRRTGNRLVRGSSGVRQVWPCSDGHVTWSMIDNPNMMRSMVRVMREEGVAGELSDIDWDNILVADTAQYTVDRWQVIFGDFFRTRTREELGALSLDNGWGLSVIKRPEEVRDDPHLTERGLFVPIRHGGTDETVRLPGPFFLVNGQSEDRPRTFEPAVPFGPSVQWRQDGGRENQHE